MKRPYLPVSKPQQTARIRPRILAVMAAYPAKATWTEGELHCYVGGETSCLREALRILCRQHRLLNNDAGYRLPPES